MAKKEFNFKFEVFKDNGTYSVVVKNIKNKKQLDNFLNEVKGSYC